MSTTMTFKKEEVMLEPMKRLFLMIDFFEKLRKRLPANLTEVKDFISGLGYPVELSEFHELAVEPVSEQKILIEYSLFTGENEWTSVQKVEVASFLKKRKSAKRPVLIKG